MRKLDLHSTIIAALVGGVLLYIIYRTRKSALFGLLVGATVQTSVRLLGVS